MRVISGERKGLPLKVMPGDNTRPTTDKIKETLFNMIGPYFDGGLALDLFAGSGALGIEALSRGIDEVDFVEKNFKAMQVVKHNVEFCRLVDYSKFWQKDANTVLRLLSAEKRKYDIVFLDPPYKLAGEIPNLVEQMIELELLKEDCLIVCEHGKEIDLPDKINVFEKFRNEKFGITQISLFEVKP